VAHKRIIKGRPLEVDFDRSHQRLQQGADVTFASRYRKTSPKDFLFEVMPTSAVDRPAQPDESIEHEQVHLFMARLRRAHACP
jgi:hypothetical protein